MADTPQKRGESPRPTYSRRDVLKLAAMGGLGLAGLPLAACAPSPAPEAKPAPTAAAPAAPTTAPAAAPAATAVPKPTVAPPPAGKTPLKKAVWTFNSRAFASGIADVWAGKYLGYFEQEGIDAEFQGSDGASQNLQFLMTGKTTFAGAVQDGIFALAARGERPPAKLVGVYTRGLIYQVGVKPDSPIQSHKDLKGKKIGVLSLAHPGMNYLRTVLKDDGLNMDKDVELLAVGQGAQAGTALQRGDIAAVVLWDTEFVVLDILGFKTRLISQPPIAKQITGGNANAVTLDLLKNDRKLVIGMHRAMAKATLFRLTNPAALVQINWKMYPESKTKGKPDDVLLREEIRAVEARNPKLDPKTFGGTKFAEFLDPKGWQLYVDFLGLGDKVKADEWYTNELVDEINDFDRKTIEDQAKNFKI